MDTNLIWQYAAVIVLIAGALVKIIYDVRRRKKNQGSCCGCSMSEACRDYKRPHNKASKPKTQLKSCCRQPSSRQQAD